MRELARLPNIDLAVFLKDGRPAVSLVSFARALRFIMSPDTLCIPGGPGKLPFA